MSELTLSPKITLLGSFYHRTLVAFNAATMHDYIASSPALDEGILAFLLSALLAPFQTSHSDANATVSLPSTTP